MYFEILKRVLREKIESKIDEELNYKLTSGTITKSSKIVPMTKLTQNNHLKKVK